MRTVNYIMFFFLLIGLNNVVGQNAKTDEEKKYLEVLVNRCDKIIDEYLEINDSEKRVVVRDIMVKQYWDLNLVLDGRDDYLKEVKNSEISSEKFEKIKAKKERKADKKIARLHKAYLKNLGKHLNDKEIDAVKDGMTFGALAHNYNGYLAMLPQLTEDEKEFIYNQFVEAREISMNKGNSRDKLGVFRQYKGRINNWLSEERGYDLQKASEEWHERIRQERDAQN